MHSDIELHVVESSNIDAVGYDQDKEILVVLFLNGNKYRYHHVPLEVYTQLINAPSVGGYFGKNIRNNDYYESFKL